MQSVELVSLNQVFGEIRQGNKCRVWKGQAATSTRHHIEVFVKYLPSRSVFIECLAGLLGRAVGLPIPRPLLVKVEPVRLPDLNLPQPIILFGSQDGQYPSLGQIVSFRIAAEKLKDWAHLLQAGCFDELIANSDRHKGNILYGGNNTFALIDHSHAIPEAQEASKALPHNSFLKIAQQSTRRDELGRRRCLNKCAAEIKSMLSIAMQDWTSLTQASLYCPAEKADQVILFLNERLDAISALVREQLG